FQNQVLSRCNDYNGNGIQLLYLMAGISVARRGVAHDRLQYELLGRELGQLFADELRIRFVCGHEDVLLWNALPKTVIRSLDERFSCTQHINELLGQFGTAYRPEPATDTTRHNDGVIILHALSFLFSFVRMRGHLAIR